MVRRIIEINQELCNGCGACAAACHEGAIGMVNGKATLLRDDYCDGLGDCLPTCPTGAITFVEREAAAYDEDAVKANMAAKKTAGCPGSAPQTIGLPLQPSNAVAVGRGGAREQTQVSPQVEPKSSGLCDSRGCPGSQSRSLGTAPVAETSPAETPAVQSRLMQWPIQIKLLPVEAPFYDNAKLLIAADCTAFSRADFHERFMKGRITIIGCPKLDMVDYAEKLTEIIRRNNIREVTVVRMEVPCCGGIQRAVETALQNSGKFIPWQVVTLGRNGAILD